MQQDFCGVDDHGGAVHRALHAVSHLIDDHAKRAELPVRFSASKLIVGDPLLLEQLELDQNETEMLEHMVLQMEKERGMDRAASIADMRFAFIRKVCDASVIKPKESRERVRSEKIDRVLTGRWTAIPFFILIMGLVFYLTFFLIGPVFQDLHIGIGQNGNPIGLFRALLLSKIRFREVKDPVKDRHLNGAACFHADSVSRQVFGNCEQEIRRRGREKDRPDHIGKRLLLPGNNLVVYEFAQSGKRHTYKRQQQHRHQKDQDVR